MQRRFNWNDSYPERFSRKSNEKQEKWQVNLGNIVHYLSNIVRYKRRNSS